MTKKILSFIDWEFLYRLIIAIIFFSVIEVIDTARKMQASRIAALQAENAALKAK